MSELQVRSIPWNQVLKLTVPSGTAQGTVLTANFNVGNAGQFARITSRDLVTPPEVKDNIRFKSRGDAASKLLPTDQGAGQDSGLLDFRTLDAIHGIETSEITLRAVTTALTTANRDITFTVHGAIYEEVSDR